MVNVERERSTCDKQETTAQNRLSGLLRKLEGRNETWQRSLTKAVVYRIGGSALTAGISYLVTKKTGMAFAIGGVDFFAKIGWYFASDQFIWANIKWGYKSSANKKTKES